MYIKFSSLSIPAKPYALATNSLVIISIRPERRRRSTVIVRHSLMIAMRIIRIIVSEQHFIGKAINNNFFICCSINSFAQHIFGYWKCNKCWYTTFSENLFSKCCGSTTLNYFLFCYCNRTRSSYITMFILRPGNFRSSCCNTILGLILIGRYSV